MKLQSQPILALFIALAFTLQSCDEDTPKVKQLDQQEDLVVTPWGNHPKSLTFLIEDGFTTREEDNKLLKVNAVSGEVVKVLVDDLKEAQRRLFKTEAQDITENSRVKILSTDPTDDNNRILWIRNEAPVNYTDTYYSYQADIVVPSAPSQTGETLYIGIRLNLLGDNFGGDLINALQYGQTTVGGPWKWSMCAWKRTANGVVTHGTFVDVTPGSSQPFRIAFDTYRYASSAGPSLIYHTPSPQAVVNSEMGLFLSGSPKTLGQYPQQFKASMTGIKAVRYPGFTFPTITWGGVKTSSLGEKLVVVNSQNSPLGQVDFQFYGIPYNLYYPNSGSYPKVLLWNAPPNAVSHEISYYTINTQGVRSADFQGAGVYGAYWYYVFPFTQGQCSGCTVRAKVRAKYANNVYSNWSPEATMVPALN